MKIGFDVDIKLDTRTYKQRMQRALRRSMMKMQALAVRRAPFHIGHLRQRIDLFPQLLADEYYLVSRAPYSAAMEYGTRPFFAPIAPLKEWARLKFGDESIGGAVWAKIAREGITPHPFMRPALYEVRQFWRPKYIKEELEGY